MLYRLGGNGTRGHSGTSLLSEGGQRVGVYRDWRVWLYVLPVFSKRIWMQHNSVTLNPRQIMMTVPDRLELTMSPTNTFDRIYQMCMFHTCLFVCVCVCCMCAYRVSFFSTDNWPLKWYLLGNYFSTSKFLFCRYFVVKSFVHDLLYPSLQLRKCMIDLLQPAQRIVETQSQRSWHFTHVLIVDGVSKQTPPRVSFVSYLRYILIIRISIILSDLLFT